MCIDIHSTWFWSGSESEVGLVVDVDTDVDGLLIPCYLLSYLYIHSSLHMHLDHIVYYPLLSITQSLASMKNHTWFMN